MLRRVQIALLLALVPSIVPRLKHPIAGLKLSDLQVYETAASLAREHQGIAIYDGADTGVDPQLRFAAPRSLFASEARKFGATETQLYVYPPVLADLLIPLSFVPLTLAGVLWTVLNYIEVALIGVLLVKLFGQRWRGLQIATLGVALFCADPIVACIRWGQVTIFLALLCLYGTWLYRKGRVRLSAAMFALAAAIKLVPLIVVAPFLVWREWGWLRSFACAILVVVAATCLINGPATLADFALHVAPSMSRGIASPNNETILSGTQLLYLMARGKPVTLGGSEVPHAVIYAGKLCSLLVLLLALWPIQRMGTKMNLSDRVRALILLLMISGPIAPVTWPHGYVPTILGLTLCWTDALRKGASTLGLLALMLCTVLVSSDLVQAVVFNLMMHGAPGGLVVAIAIMPAVAVVTLSLTELARLRTRRIQPAFLAVDVVQPTPVS